MNTPDCSLTDDGMWSIAELEARFEMEALPIPGPGLTTAWGCSCRFEY